mgnify:FL=1
MLSIDKDTTKKIKYISSHFEEWSVKEKISAEQFIWLVNFEQPDMSYAFNDSRMGISNTGKFIWQGTSGCSCPTPYEEGLSKGDYYDMAETIELGKVREDNEGHYLDDDWLSQLQKSVNRIYTALKYPSKLKVEEILSEENTELRRVLIEKLGMDNFIKKANPVNLDSTEVGDLIKIDLKDDEPIVILIVKDSSTKRQYLLRVPTKMKTALEAKAWTFGFEKEQFTIDEET